MLSLQIFDAPGGNLLLDASTIASGVTFTTGEHGFESLQATLKLSLAEAFRLFDRAGLPHVVVSDGAAGVVWEGRLEDVQLAGEGVQITALGYWRALSDVPYTALWSLMALSDWRTCTAEDGADFQAERWQLDNNHRLYLAPQSGETFGTGNVGGWALDTPAEGARRIVACDCTYTLVAPADWRARIQAWGADGSVIATPWTLDGNGGTQTGTLALTFAECDRLTVSLHYNTTDAAYAGGTGVAYLKLTGIRVRTTTGTKVTAADIAAAAAAFVHAANAGQLSDAAALIDDPGVDLTDEVYQDKTPAEILTALAAIGDAGTPAATWETGVYEGRLLYFRTRGAAGRAWYVDAGDLQVERSLDGLYNAAYAVYRDDAGRTLRTATAEDAVSVARYGLRRRAAVQAQTTSAAQAGVQRDAYVDEHGELQPRVKLTFGALYDTGGARWPLWAARAGDQVTARNLPPGLSAAIDQIRTFRVARTAYRCDDDTLSVEPEARPPELGSQVAETARAVKDVQSALLDLQWTLAGRGAPARYRLLLESGDLLLGEDGSGMRSE